MYIFVSCVSVSDVIRESVEEEFLSPSATDKVFYSEKKEKNLDFAPFKFVVEMLLLGFL